MSDLRGHVSIVTGGNRGLGLGIATGLAEAGADVVIWGRDEHMNEQAAASIRALGRRCLTIGCDVTDEAQVNESFSASAVGMGQIDSVFANAGGDVRPTPFADLTLQEWHDVTRLNLDAVFLCFRAAARHMIIQGTGGALVATSSLSAFQGAPAMEHYAASKAGVAAMVRGLAVELGRYRIRANVLVPGWFDTDLTSAVKGNEAISDRITRRIPRRHWGEASELGPVAVFLADKALTYHTGATMFVDGGYSLT